MSEDLHPTGSFAWSLWPKPREPGRALLLRPSPCLGWVTEVTSPPPGSGHVRLRSRFAPAAETTFALPSLGHVRLRFGFAPTAETAFAVPPLGRRPAPLQVCSSRRNSLQRSPFTRLLVWSRSRFARAAETAFALPSLGHVRLRFGFARAAETAFALPPLGHGATSFRVRSDRRNGLRCPSTRSPTSSAPGLLQPPKQPSTLTLHSATRVVSLQVRSSRRNGLRSPFTRPRATSFRVRSSRRNGLRSPSTRPRATLPRVRSSRRNGLRSPSARPRVQLCQGGPSSRPKPFCEARYASR